MTLLSDTPLICQVKNNIRKHVFDPGNGEERKAANTRHRVCLYFFLSLDMGCFRVKDGFLLHWFAAESRKKGSRCLGLPLEGDMKSRQGGRDVTLLIKRNDRNTGHAMWGETRLLLGHPQEVVKYAHQKKQDQETVEDKA